MFNWLWLWWDGASGGANTTFPNNYKIIRNIEIENKQLRIIESQWNTRLESNGRWKEETKGGRQWQEQ